MSAQTVFGGDPIGALFFFSLVSLPIAVVLSFLLLARYQRAVLRSMQASAGAATVAAAEPPSARRSGPASGRPLTVQVLEEGAGFDATSEASARLTRARGAAWRSAAVYALAGGAHAAVATVLLFLFDDHEFLPIRTLFVWFVQAWPIVPTVFFVAVGSRRLRIAGILGYFFVAMLISPLPAQELLVLWGVLMGFPTLLILAVGNRRLRAVGPIVLAATLIVVAGATIAFSLAGNLFIASGGAWPGWWFIALGAAVLCAFAALAWMTLRWAARRYRRKKTSDLGLMIDAWWLIVTLWECLDFSNSAGPLALFVLGAFAAYKGVLWLGFRLFGPKREEEPADLLLLRVFGFRKRSERLLDELGHKWRYAGPITLISAPDLATSYVEPHEFYDFLGGRLSRSFVKNPDDLDRRVRGMDREPDPDGRYRVNEFFCHADTWQPTMRALAERSQAVLMDLRSFAENNQGCTYELQQLLDMVPLERVVLVIDDTTDRALLERTVHGMWQTLSPASPNLGTGDATLRMVVAAKQSPRHVKRLLLLLFARGRAGADAPVAVSGR
jgi:hypothetical protein